MTLKEYREYEASVENSLKDYSFVSSGACPGCDDCSLAKNPTEEELGLAGEPHFSWTNCDICKRSLGGDRYPAHARDRQDNIVHFAVCCDCYYYIAYGRLDDRTMLEVEKNS